MLRPIVLVLLLAFLAAVPAAQAQTQAVDPKVSITVTPPTAATIVPLGGTATIKVDVHVRIDNAYCSAQETISVTLAPPADSGIPGLAATLPASLNVALAPNLVPGTVPKQYVEGNATALLTVTAAKTTTADHDHAYSVKASTPAGFPGACRGASASGPAAASGEKAAAVRTGPAATMTDTMSGGVSVNAGSCGANVSAPGVTVNAGSTDCSKKSFFLPLQVEVAVLFAVGLLRRRL